MFDIEKNVPIPKGTRSRYQFPLANMDVGDSFLVPVDDASERGVSSIRQALYSARKKDTDGSVKLATSMTPDGLRVWRVE